jgi:two-component system nitrogen regulation sensor histidine kinase NtrY
VIGYSLRENNISKNYFLHKSKSVLPNKLYHVKSRQIEILKDVNLIQTISGSKNSDEFLEPDENENFSIYAYRNKCLAFWNDNRLLFQNFIIDSPFQTQYVHNQNGWYQIISSKIGEYDVYCAYHFYKEYPKSNSYFVNQFDEQLGLRYFKLSDIKIQEYESKVSNKFFKDLPSIKGNHYVEFNLFLWSSIFYALSFVFSLAFGWVLFYKNQTINLVSFSKFVLIVVLIQGLILFFDWKNVVNGNLDFFSPELAAYSDFFPSFAHGFIASVVFFAFIALVFLIFKNYRQHYFYLEIFLNIVSWFLISYFILYIIPEFINDSVVVYDFKDPTLLNSYSVFGVLNMLIVSLAWVLWSRFSKGFSSQNIKLPHILLSEIIIGTVVLFCFYLNRNENFFLLLSVLVLTTIINILLLKLEKLNFNGLIIVGIFLSMLLSVQFEQVNSRKEKELRKVFASNIISKKDFDNELLLKTIESELISSNAIDNYFYYSDSLIKDLELDYKYTYFNDLIKDYEVEIIKFDSNGIDLKENNYSFSELNALYNSADHNSYASYFSYIKDFHYIGGYISKYEICPKEEILGHVFILIKPKVKSEAYNFENFFSASSKNYFQQNDYSYAIYQNNQLIKGSGKFSYKLVEDFEYGSKGDESFIDHKKYSHFYKQINKDAYVLVSKKAFTRNKIISVYTFNLLLFSLMLSIVFGSIYIVVFVLSKFNNVDFCQKLYVSLTQYFHLINVKKLYLGTKIKIIFILAVVLISSIVVFVVVYNVNSNFKNKQIDILDKKVTQINNELEHVFQSDEKENLRNLINDLANRFEVDINLYNTDGTLFQSANNRMFFEGWFSSYMNPKAYHQLSFEKQYQFKHSENIGKLKYLSSYVSIFDKDYQIVSYLNVPYFAKEIDLQNQFANFLSDLINVLTLILVVFLIIANIIGTSLVKPLKLITESLAKIKLGSENKYIQLERNDELGQLVDEYNKMIHELDVSTQKLALSEREGAWKDMAKQVAHEIKNPLTPMRLHLQHLQLAIQRKDENVNVKVASISQMLIEQIDQLSKMAEEFSSFAAMPIAVKEKIHLQSLLKNTISLFSVHSDFDIIFGLQDSDLYVFADSQQLQRVFTNIIKNAIQANSENENGQLEISIINDGGFALIRFKDNGVGISEDFKSKVFAPNFSTKNSGMGLGLSISKKIIESFDGAIWFESELNIGTTFFVKLPIL